MASRRKNAKKAREYYDVQSVLYSRKVDRAGFSDDQVRERLQSMYAPMTSPELAEIGNILAEINRFITEDMLDDLELTYLKTIIDEFFMLRRKALNRFIAARKR